MDAKRQLIDIYPRVYGSFLKIRTPILGMIQFV